MAFEVHILSEEEGISIGHKYKFAVPWLCQLDKERNAALYMVSFGFDGDHPGQAAFVWDNMVCSMYVYPFEWFQWTRGKEEKVVKISGLRVPETFDKNVDELIDMIEEAFSSFVVRSEHLNWNIKAIIDRNQLKKRIKYRNGRCDVITVHALTEDND